MLYIFFSGHNQSQFRILNIDSYKSIPSTIISIIIIISSITFSFYSIIEYMKFDSPSIFYLKKYDNISNKTLLLKDILFILKVSPLRTKPYSLLELDYKANYRPQHKLANLNIEESKIGKKKYKYKI